jgi:hypothetical protein
MSALDAVMGRGGLIRGAMAVGNSVPVIRADHAATRELLDELFNEPFAFYLPGDPAPEVA